MTDVFVSLDVSFEYKTLAHGILTVLSYVNGRLNCVPQFKLVGFNWDYLQ